MEQINDYKWSIGIPHGWNKLNPMMTWLLDTLDENAWKFKMDASKNELCPLFKNKTDAYWFWIVWS